MTPLGKTGWDFAADATAWATNYERFLVPTIFGPCARDLLGSVDLRPGQSVLDVACGTGIVGRSALEEVGETGTVVGVDLNPAMIGVAHKLEPRITWHQGNAEQLPCADGSVDAVVCQQGLQFFPDRAVALDEMARVLTPGGRLVIAVCSSIAQSPGYAALAHGVERHLGVDAAASLRNGPFGFPDGAALRSLVDAAGFKSVELRTQAVPIDFPSVGEWVRRYAVSTPMVSAFAAATAGAREELVATVARALGLAEEDELLQFPLVSNVVLASA